MAEIEALSNSDRACSVSGRFAASFKRSLSVYAFRAEPSGNLWWFLSFDVARLFPFSLFPLPDLALILGFLVSMEGRSWLDIELVSFVLFLDSVLEVFSTGVASAGSGLEVSADSASGEI